MTFTEWLDNNWENDNMFPPTLEAQKALSFLQEYLLGNDWYIINPLTNAQANCEVVDAILSKYSDRYRKEVEERNKNYDRKKIKLNDLDNLIYGIETKKNAKSLSDEYLKENNFPTRKDVGIGEYSYGIMMIPEDYVLPYLKELSNILNNELKKENSAVHKLKNEKGIVRHIDDIGGITIPKEIRKITRN